MQVLATNLSSTPPQHDLLTHKCFLQNFIFECVGEYFWATHVLTPFFFAPTWFNTTLALIVLHIESNGFFPFFVKNYESNRNLKFLYDSFKLVFQHISHLFASDLLLGLFLNTFKNVFTQKILNINLHNRFNFVPILHKVTFHVKLHMSLGQPTF